jgi:hypothetical protein
MTAGGAALALAALIAHAQVANADEAHGDEDFVSHMTRMQYFTHKLGLAVSAQNTELQGYYVHEVEEVVEAVSEVDEYKGIEVGRLVKTILVPALEGLEVAMAEGTQEQVDEAYGGMLQACNTCHRTSNHGFLRIERQAENPYMQSFAPAQE